MLLGLWGRLIERDTPQAFIILPKATYDSLAYEDAVS